MQYAPLAYANADVEDILATHREQGDAHAPANVAAFLGLLVSALATRPYPEAHRHASKQLGAPLYSKRVLLAHLRRLLANAQCAFSPSEVETLYRHLVTRPSKSHSGILSLTVLTSPGAFSCKHDCFYCPNEPGQPRSYLRDEPAVLRANQNGFSPALQLTDRAVALYENGHAVDKLELLILGGTWSSYPIDYRVEFCRDLFHAANTLFEPAPRRAALSLAEEQRANSRMPRHRVIGVTVETRPDAITPAELVHLRAVGCTRVQLGVQTTDDAVLRRVNRGCTTADAARAIALLKSNGFKVDVHAMLNLPGASPESDADSLARLASDPALLADQIKLYPCELVPFTRIERWFAEGSYTPYTTAQVLDVIRGFKRICPRFMRINRIGRDIPAPYQAAAGCAAGSPLHVATDLRLQLGDAPCACIRCREVAGGTLHGNEVVSTLVYAASGGTEHFVAVESPDASVLYAFARVRVNAASCDAHVVFPELVGLALLRELHVYGELATNGAKGPVQHNGLGRRLLREADAVARRSGCAGVAVIAGEGAREYYARAGFVALPGEGRFMVRRPGISGAWVLWALLWALAVAVAGVVVEWAWRDAPAVFLAGRVVYGSAV